MSQRLDTLRARRTARCESGRRAAASSAKNHPACSLPVLREAGRPRLLLPAPLTACCWATLLEACFQKRCPAACSAAAHSPARQVPRVVARAGVDRFFRGIRAASVRGLSTHEHCAVRGLANVTRNSQGRLAVARRDARAA